jgi:DNA-binding response OmpR family regulator
MEKMMNEETKNLYDVLFIEDEKAIKENYVRYLKRYFSNVYEAENGEEAYKIYKEKKPHILIIDINIPKLNGIELLKKIREEDHTTKAIMLTAHSDTSYLLEASSLKLTKYLVKPISREELKNALKLVLSELSKFSTSSKKKLELGDGYYWDYTLEELFLADKPIVLTNKEKKTVTLLFSNLNKTFTYDEIIIEIWYDDEENKLDALKTIIKNLRKKLPKEIITNIYGLGYKVSL